MSFMPSRTYVAQKLFRIGAPEDIDWEDASQADIDHNMTLATIAIDAILSWQALHRPDGSNRYCFEPIKSAEDDLTWGIYDRKRGLNTVLGVIHDPILAQQIVNDLNKHDSDKMDGWTQK